MSVKQSAGIDSPFVLQTLPPIRAAFPQSDGLDWLAARGSDFRRQYKARAREAVALLLHRV
jgi:hypothetical protein